jgi:hypothetical protein
MLPNQGRSEVGSVAFSLSTLTGVPFCLVGKGGILMPIASLLRLPSVSQYWKKFLDALSRGKFSIVAAAVLPCESVT